MNITQPIIQHLKKTKWLTYSMTTIFETNRTPLTDTTTGQGCIQLVQTLPTIGERTSQVFVGGLKGSGHFW